MKVAGAGCELPWAAAGLAGEGEAGDGPLLGAGGPPEGGDGGDGGDGGGEMPVPDGGEGGEGGEPEGGPPAGGAPAGGPPAGGGGTGRAAAACWYFWMVRSGLLGGLMTMDMPRWQWGIWPQKTQMGSVSLIRTL